MRDDYDIIVVGGGHAGIEAAWAAARMGARVALITMERTAIGRMSCNPAIGGLGKGHMVREIDALGGLMGLATDRAGIQFRMLNRSKGPAVWAPRAQCDRAAYAAATQDLLAGAKNLEIIEGVVERLETAEVRGATGGLSASACSGARPSPLPLSLEGRGVTPGATGGGAAGGSATGGLSASACSGARPSPLPLSLKGRGVTPGATGGSATGGLSASGLGECGPHRHRVTGVTLANSADPRGSSRLRTLTAPVVILTTGTFMRGLMHCGESQQAGGRIGEQAAVGLSAALEALGFQLGRLKTGTPPRVHRDTLDYDRLEIQPGDDVPVPFSFMTDGIHQRQVPCWVTYTGPAAHDHIRANLHRAPMYSGQIQSTGPRYCPSIEDKVVRFADKEKHQVFLEPEGYDNERVYCNGISTSLPADVQDVMVRSIAGLERARILQYGYAVEYDWVPTHQIRATLETKLVRGLYLAGQINGTSGYEEAAGQGIWAGINASLALAGGSEPFLPGRHEAYLGVMIDDLITRPPIEPYRMFTSRAEYRLALRSDNADERLTPLGRRTGLVDDQRWAQFERKQTAVRHIQALANDGRIVGLPLVQWMRRPDADVDTLARAISNEHGRIFCTDDLWQVLVRAKYAGYLDRQTQQIERLSRLESAMIPADFDFRTIRDLRAEARENLSRVQPRTLGQAGRISGITPADVTILWIHINARTAQSRRNGTAPRPVTA